MLSSVNPIKEKVGVITESDLASGEIKMDDLNANTLDVAKMIRGTAKSMGIEVKG